MSFEIGRKKSSFYGLEALGKKILKLLSETTENKSDFGCLDSDYFRRQKEEAMREVEEAKSRNWNVSAHGSLEVRQRMIEIYSEWEKKGYAGRNFTADVIKKDQKLRVILLEEQLQSQEHFKETIRKYGCPTNTSTLLDFEIFDLPWLIERRERKLGLPVSVSYDDENGKLVGMSTSEWIKRLETKGVTSLRHELTTDNMTNGELEAFIERLKSDIETC